MQPVILRPAAATKAAKDERHPAIAAMHDRNTDALQQLQAEAPKTQSATQPFG